MPRPSRPGPDAAATGVRSILVATDFSEGAKAAAERAHNLASLHDARLALLHVAPEGVSDDMRRVAEQGLDQIAAELGTSGTATEVVSGSVGTAISEAAERLGADLIVIGAHGAHWLKDKFVGSTAERVADCCSIPVLQVKHPGSEPYQVVLLAVDLSEHAEVTASRAIALTPGSQHLLVHVAAVIGENLLRFSGASHEDIEELRRAQADEAVPHVWAIARAVGRPVRIVVEPGRPEQRVPQLAHDLDAHLVAVGNKRLTGLRHALLGSVARHTIRHAPCDVLIVHIT